MELFGNRNKPKFRSFHFKKKEMFLWLDHKFFFVICCCHCCCRKCVCSANAPEIWPSRQNPCLVLFCFSFSWDCVVVVLIIFFSLFHSSQIDKCVYWFFFRCRHIVIAFCRLSAESYRELFLSCMSSPTSSRFYLSHSIGRAVCVFIHNCHWKYW